MHTIHETEQFCNRTSTIETHTQNCVDFSAPLILPASQRQTECPLAAWVGPDRSRPERS